MALPDGWSRRCTIDLPTVAQSLVDFPVHLDAACFPDEVLDSASSNKAAADGSDLRFSVDDFGLTELPFEVVRWVQDATPASRRATVHVKVPTLSISATTRIYAWWKNASATMPAVTDANGRNAVWSSYAHVLHLASTSAATNSTGAASWTYEGSPAATYDGAAGIMLDLDGTDDAVQGPSYNPSDHLVEILVRVDSTADQIIVGRSVTGGSISESIWVSSSKPTAYIDTDGSLSYGHIFADTVNASTADLELWQVRNRSVAGGDVITKALPTTEATHQAWASDGTYMYSIGGHQFTISSPITANSRYNPATDTWSAMTALPAARWGMASVYLGGKIYCMGGTTNGSAASSRNDIYDIAGNSWSAGTAIPASLTATVAQGQRACTDGTYIYVMASATLERYDPGGNSWQALSSQPSSPGNWQSLICDGTYIYSIGGSNVPTNIRRYVIATDSWDAAVYDSAPYGAWAMVCEPIGDGRWCIGFGRKGSNQEQASDLFTWNPTTKDWARLQSYEVPTNATASAIIGDKLYVYGGWVIGRAETYSFGHHACFDVDTEEWITSPALVEFVRAGYTTSGRILTSAPYAGAGRWYVGRQDALTSLRSGAKVGELRISASARSKTWLSATNSTLLTASTFATKGSAEGLAELGSAAATTSVGSINPALSKAVSGQAATTATGAAAPEISKALTGNVATTATGAAVLEISKALTGNAATTATGAAAPEISKALTGSAATTATGSLVPGGAITGTGVTTATGSLSPALSKDISGQAAATSVGTLSVTLSSALAGVASVTSAGSLTAQTADTILSGQQTTTATGALAASITTTLTGVGSTADTGALTAIQSPIEGMQVATAVGTLTVALTMGLTGRQTVASAGYLGWVPDFRETVYLKSGIRTSVTLSSPLSG